MKKKIFVIAILMTMAFCANAQRDGFFSGYNDDFISRDIDDINGLLVMPNSNIGSYTNDSAPLGSGLLILTALGGGYVLTRRKRQ